MRKWLRDLRSRFQGKRRGAGRNVCNQPVNLGLEELQARNLLSVSPVSLVGHGQLMITGTKGDDILSVSNASTGNKVVVDYNGQNFSFAAASVKKIAVQTGAGNDLFSNNTGIACQVNGGVGNDTLNGGSGNDILQGGVGKDSLFGGAGKDLLTGDDGNDLLDGGTDDDTLEGGAGNDQEIGGVGDDNLQGDDGLDSLSGGIGNDFLRGGAANDVLHGGLGNDTCDGGLGSDSVSGDEGEDDVTGENENTDAAFEANLASVAGATGAIGKAEYNATSGEFQVEVHGAVASTSYDVFIDVAGDGSNFVKVGTVATDGKGQGALELRNSTDVPAVQAGSMVQLKNAAGDVIQGTFSAQKDDEGDQTEEFQAPLINDQGVTGLVGIAQFNAQEKNFEAHIRGAAANTTYNVTVDKAVIGQITTDSKGCGHLEISQATFTVAEKSTIQVSDLAGNPPILHGTFTSATSSDD